jgi:hypothetical protein
MPRTLVKIGLPTEERIMNFRNLHLQSHPKPLSRVADYARTSKHIVPYSVWIKKSEKRRRLYDVRGYDTKRGVMRKRFSKLDWKESGRKLPGRRRPIYGPPRAPAGWVVQKA